MSPPAVPLAITLLPPASLKASTRNARTHSSRQIGQIADSIRAFGFVNPVLADPDGTIIAGHGRHAAALRLGLAEVPVITLGHLSETERRALAIADNKIALNAGWDLDLLARELDALATLDDGTLDITVTGFEAGEIDGLIQSIDEQSDPDDTPLPAPSGPAITALGDLWRLGPHRLLCADATDTASYSTLFRDTRAAMIFTDPPYNVRVAGIVGRGRTRHREFAMASGEMTPQAFTTFLTTVMGHLSAFSRDGALHYHFMDWRHITEILEAGRATYDELVNLCVWAKTTAGQGSFYRSQHELVFVFRKGQTPHRNNIELGRHGRNRSNVWTFAGVNTFRKGRMEELMAHPTVKPAALVIEAIKDASRRGDIILDPFLGSGTTLIAAERTGRLCHGLEIDPIYVDGIIRRWQVATGRDAVRDRDGALFADLEAATAQEDGHHG